MSMHAANPERSQRLSKTLMAVSRRGGCTTMELAKATGSVAPSTDVSELRQRGWNVLSSYEGRTKTGRKVYRYTLGKRR